MASHVFKGRTLVLSDGGVESLLACAYVREEATLCGLRADAEEANAPLVMPFVANLTEAAIDSIIRQAEIMACKVIEPSYDLARSGSLRAGEEEVKRLVAATFMAAGAGCNRVFWPTSAAICGGLPSAETGAATTNDDTGLDAGRLLFIEESGAAVTRLVGLLAEEHGVPSIHIYTPFSALGTKQIADLFTDMELPLEACWFAQSEGLAAGNERQMVDARRERARWNAAFALTV